MLLLVLVSATNSSAIVHLFFDFIPSILLTYIAHNALTMFPDDSRRMDDDNHGV